MDAPRLRSNPAAAGPERALRKEVTALADRLKALTAEEERAHAATLARFDDTDDDEDDGAVPPPPPPPPGGSSSRKAPPAPISTSLAGALADDRWDACQKWTFAHAAAPYPSAEEKAALARKAGWPPGRVNHWFSNMRKRKYLKLRDGTRALRDAFEAQLYHFLRRGADADASP